MYHYNCECICGLLSKLSHNETVKLYTYGSDVILKFICVENGRVKGFTADGARVTIDCENIAGFSIYPKIPPDWHPIAPGADYPLPHTYPIVGVLGFEARTGPGGPSALTLFHIGVPIESASITEVPSAIVWNLGDGYPLSALTLTNTGSRAVYIRNLTTGLPPGWLGPGENYSVEPIEPGKVIEQINVTWEDKGTGATGSLYIDGALISTLDIPDTPETSSWSGLHYPTTDTTEIRIEINCGYARIESSEVIYEAGCRVLAYVTNQDGGNVSVIDTADNTVIDTITAGSRPSGAAITPNGRQVYIGNWFYDVSVIDTSLGAVTATIPGVNSFGTAVTPDGNFAYITNLGGSCTVTVVETATNTVVTHVDVGGCLSGGGAYDLAVTPDGAYVYLASWWGNSVSVIDTSTNTLYTVFGVGNRPQSIAITPDGALAYVTVEADNQVKVIDIATNTIIHTIPVGSGPFGVAITPDGALAYVTLRGDGQVIAIDIATSTVVHTIPVGNFPTGIAITPDGALAYAVNNFDSTVSVIELGTNTVTATVDVGNRPYWVAIGTVC